MRDLRRSDPKHMELHNELYDEGKKALRQYWFSLDFTRKLVGRSSGLSLLSPKCAGLVSRRPDAL